MRPEPEPILWLCYLLVIAIVIRPFGTAQAGDEGFVSLQVENDLWGSSDDRYYTHGTKLSFASTVPPPQHLSDIAQWIPWYREGEIGIYGYEIAQKIFTPEDITAPDLIEGDRPYAGWLYFNAGIGRIYQDLGDRESMNFLGYTIGIIGPASLAEHTQTLVHAVVDGDDPKGWSNQLKSEPGLNLWYLHKYRHIYNFDEHLQYEIGPHAGFILGNVYTLGAMGFMFRYGTHLKADIGPPSIAPGFSGAPVFNPNRQTHWYLFAGLEARAVARNVFLDGNTWRDSHSVVKRDLVGDLQIGFAYHFNDMRLSFVQMFRTREYDNQPEPTQFGALNITFFFDHESR